MNELLQSNASLLLGVVAALAVATLRALSKDRAFRSDLRGALVLLLSFLVLRSLAWMLEGNASPGVLKGLTVAWMLTLAFGLIRSVVSVALLALRFRGVPPAKILRDVIDFTLYGVTAIPIIKSQFTVDLTGVVATSAIASVVLGLALQDTLGNLFAGLSLQVERPFQVGDFVTIREHTGRVMQIAWRATRIETMRGESITLPNNLVAKEGIMNFSRGGRSVGIDVPFQLSYDTPPNLVRSTVLEVMRDVPLVLREPPPLCRVRAYDPYSVRFEVRFYVNDYGHKDTVLDELHSRLWYRFRRDQIEVPYPTQTLHLRSKDRRGSSLPEQRVVDLLRSVEVFSMLSGEALLRLARQMTLRRFGRGEVIIEEGAAGATFYLVVSGEVSVRTQKTAVEVSRLGRGQYFGEMSLLTGAPRSATVLAVEDALLLELDRGAFSELFAQTPELASQMSAVLAKRSDELRAVLRVAPPHSEAKDASHVLDRLRQIFGLKAH